MTDPDAGGPTTTAGRDGRGSRAGWTVLHDRMTGAGTALAMVALAAIVLAYSVEVVLRYGLDAPTLWTTELVSYLLLVITFLAMPAVTASSGHVSVTALQERLSPQVARRAGRAIAGVGAAVCLFMAAITVGEVARQSANDVRMMAALPIPKAWVSVWIVYGFASSALHFLRHAGRPPSDPTRTGPARAVPDRADAAG